MLVFKLCRFSSATMKLLSCIAGLVALLSCLCPSKANDLVVPSQIEKSFLRRLQGNSCDEVEPTRLPARIEAEKFCDSWRVQIEDTGDYGGGKDVGHINGGSWMAFPVDVPVTGEYLVRYRVASPLGIGSFLLEYYGGSPALGTIDSLPPTSGWQEWTTVSHAVELPGGTHIVAVKANSWGWNLNWLEFSLSEGASTSPPGPTSTPTLQASPGPTPNPTQQCSGDSSTLIPGRIEAEAYCDSNSVQVEDTEDDGGGLNVGYIGLGSWMAYPITVPSEGAYTIKYRVASPSGIGSFDLETYGGAEVLGSIDSVPSTGGWQDWTTVSHTVKLAAGENTIAVKAKALGWNLNWLEISANEPLTSVPTLSATAQPLPSPSTQISSSPSEEPSSIPSEQPSLPQETQSPSNTPGLPPSASACSDAVAAATQSGKIEAEDYCDMSGMIQEETKDEGGGYNLGWIDAGDYLAFPIQIEATATYRVEYRIASPDGEGSLQLELGDGTFLGNIDSFPSTGEWQSWATVSHLVEITGGSHTLIVNAKAPGWNINWLQLIIPQPTTSPTNMPTNLPTRSPTFAPTSSANPTHFPSLSSAPTVPQPTQGPNSIPTDYGGWLRAQGKTIVNEKGDIVILRGMGFGGWMVQEPYMMLVEGLLDGGQHSMFEEINELIGPENLKTYHQVWLDNYCTEEDVIELARSGFNSLRAPLHYNLFTLPIDEEPVRGEDTWLNDGFERLDRLLEWCQNAGIYLILDLHAAPGGQGGNIDISDYDRKF